MYCIDYTKETYISCDLPYDTVYYAVYIIILLLIMWPPAKGWPENKMAATMQVLAFKRR